MCMDRTAMPVERVRLGIAARPGLRRKTGLRKLRKVVRTCEYRDVHVTWEMHAEGDGRAGPAGGEGGRRGHAAAAVAAAAGAKKRKNVWRRFIYYCCAFGATHHAYPSA